MDKFLEICNLKTRLNHEEIKNLNRPVTSSETINNYFIALSWRKEWQSTPVFLPTESHGQRSLAGYRAWGRRASDTTATNTAWLSTQKCTTAYLHR